MIQIMIIILLLSELSEFMIILWNNDHIYNGIMIGMGLSDNDIIQWIKYGIILGYDQNLYDWDNFGILYKLWLYGIILG